VAASAAAGFADRVGVVLGGIGTMPDWWIASTERLDDAGYRGIWAWDHFMVRAGRPKPVLEAWTLLAMAAARTRRVTVGPLVANVMNRHPAVLASMAATLAAAAPGRLVLGIGIGGAPREHEQLGIPFPPVPERVARLEEALAVIRALWRGEPVTRPSPWYPLTDATLLPAPDPVPPILVGGQSSTGARLAARLGDGWATRPDLLERLRPVYLEACASHGRDPGPIVVSFEDGRSGVDSVAGTPWAADPAGRLAQWRGRGAESVVLTARTTADVDALVEIARG
jgi:alkanesulfonate monooxygenase SsuD/methylene tetrahydromethanopterin reductase-like flavin-dependent oxidoreductase (luciferase family)